MPREGIFTIPSQSQSSYAVGTNIINGSFILYGAVWTLGGACSPMGGHPPLVQGMG